MKKLAVVLLLITLCLTTHAQNRHIDSLIGVAIVHSRKEKIALPKNPDSLLNRLPFVKSPAERIRMIYDIILFNSGELDFKKALYYHQKILDLTRQHHDSICESVILSELGFTIAENGNSPEGLKMIFKALAMAEATHNDQAIGIVYDNLGVIFNSNTRQQIDYYKKALKFSLAGNDYFFASAELGNLSLEYRIIKKTDSSSYYLNKSIELAAAKNVPLMLATDIVTFGRFQNDPKVSLKYYNMALQLPIYQRDVSGRSQILSAIAFTYQRQGKIDSALYYAKTAFAVTKDKFIVQKIGPAKLLSIIYTRLNVDSALKYTNIYYTLHDSLYNINKVAQNEATVFAEHQKQQEAETQKIAYRNTLRGYFLAAVIVFLIVLAYVFWRSNRQNQKANHLLQEQKEEIETQRDNLKEALDELKNTQAQLVQREKMASLGELTAGIAHEIQNPLNFVNNFSEVSAELVDEMDAELDKGDIIEAKAISAGIKQNLEKIRHHGKRADGIVKGMLQHSQASSGQKDLTDLNALADEYLRLAYHGLRAKDKSFNAELITNLDDKLPKVNIVPQDIGRVLLNLFNNAFYATKLKAKTAAAGYKPAVEITTGQQNGSVIVSVKDNGTGIPNAIKDKIMQPFFTTKPTGEGTGLGLSLSYDIVVKGHGGKIEMDTEKNAFTKFIVSLPIN